MLLQTSRRRTAATCGPWQRAYEGFLRPASRSAIKVLTRHLLAHLKCSTGARQRYHRRMVLSGLWKSSSGVEVAPCGVAPGLIASRFTSVLVVPIIRLPQRTPTKGVFLTCNELQPAELVQVSIQFIIKQDCAKIRRARALRLLLRCCSPAIRSIRSSRQLARSQRLTRSHGSASAGCRASAPASPSAARRTLYSTAVTIGEMVSTIALRPGMAH